VSDSQLPKTTPIAWTAFVELPVSRLLALVGKVGRQNANGYYATAEYYTFTERCGGTVPVPGSEGPCPPGAAVPRDACAGLRTVAWEALARRIDVPTPR
jgi:hypothetical protein